MCGICGTVGRADPELIRRMNAVQAHRGPDGEGIELFAPENGRIPAALGHRRLSIIDLSDRGAQPMSYGNGRYWITYNGELYNFRELRAGLEAEGFRFQSDCDTEVLLAMYARYGDAMLGRLNGIFAFAIWDAERGELFLARDRLGVKPLYYSLHEGTLYFASEAKALLQALPPPALNHKALPAYLTFLWVPDPETLFDGIRKLPPGHVARFAKGHLDVREYWDATYPVEEGSDEDWAARVRQSVERAIARQTVSDVPVGAFLSGGLDSGAIVATMRELAGDAVTYTVGFDEEDLAHEIVPDDLRYARSLARELGVENHERILRPDIVELLPRLVWHMDEPVADPAAISTYLICSAARERLTVILSGMGGDELFAGYPRYLAAKLAGPVDLIPRGLRGALRRATEGRLTMGKPGRLRGPRRNLMKLMRGIDQGPIDRYLTYCSYYRGDELPSLLSPELRAELSDSDPFSSHKDYANRVGDIGLNRLLYMDMKTFLPCLNLSYTDKMSMAASTEVRVPLLDDELVELSARVPPGLKLHRLTRKYVLKRAMEGVLPPDVIWRAKAGFGAPLRAWIGRELRPLVDDLLSPATVRRRGLFDPQAIQKLVADNDAGTADNALRIWALLWLELWQQTFIDGSRESLPVPPPPVASP